MDQIVLSAGRLDFRQVGPKHGTTVVFVHGLLTDHTLWSDVPERLAQRGFRCFAPTWPLGSHRTSMNPGTDLSPRGVARIILSFLVELDLHDVILVGNDSGGAICQFLIDEDPARVACLVLTNCDAFEVFPPAPFDLLVRLCRRPVIAGALLQSMCSKAVRKLAFGWLTKRDLEPVLTRAWVRPYLTDASVRRDVAAFTRNAHPAELVDVGSRLGAFAKPVLLAWGPNDRFFTIELADRLLAAFPDSRLVEIPEALTFVPRDQPKRLADEIAAFVPSRS